MLLMKLLLDTCTLIPIEPTNDQHIEENTVIIAAMQRVCNQLGGQLYIHPKSQQELDGDRDESRRDARRQLLQRYIVLENPPLASKELEGTVGSASEGSHDAVDHALLASVFHNAVDYLVTSDKVLLAKASRAGLVDKVLKPATLLAKLTDLLPQRPATRPAISQVYTYELMADDPFFDSLRTDYDGFNEWLAKCQREHRQAWVVRRPDDSISALAIVNPEDPPGHDLPGSVLKICTFKIAMQDTVYGYSELLLQSIFDYSRLNGYDTLYVEVFDKHSGLIRLFENFGFEDVGLLGASGDHVLVKRSGRSEEEIADLSPLEFNILCGPQRVQVPPPMIYAVPIQPEFHKMLFPEVEDQLDMWHPYPFGNAIRKVYLCHSKLRQLPPGALVLFYRSRDLKGVRCIGVAEGSCRSSDSGRILRYAGSRTVYPIQRIEEMCRKPVFAFIFRHAIVLEQDLSLDELVLNGVLNGAPMSITRVSQEAAPWLRTKLEPWL